MPKRIIVNGQEDEVDESHPSLSQPDPDPQAEIEEWRANTSASREDFAIACMLAGEIIAEEAEEWAAGNALPASVVTAITLAISNTQDRQIALIRAKGATVIRRSHQIIEILRTAQAFNLTPEETDQLFIAANSLP